MLKFPAESPRLDKRKLERADQWPVLRGIYCYWDPCSLGLVKIPGARSRGRGRLIPRDEELLLHGMWVQHKPTCQRSSAGRPSSRSGWQRWPPAVQPESRGGRQTCMALALFLLASRAVLLQAACNGQRAAPAPAAVLAVCCLCLPPPRRCMPLSIFFLAVDAAAVQEPRKDRQYLDGVAS